MKTVKLLVLVAAVLTTLVVFQLRGNVTLIQAAKGRAHTATVHIREKHDQYGFLPKKLTVRLGTRVTWVNNSDVPHTVTGIAGWRYGSNMFNEDHKVSVTFKKAGTFHYMCAVHPYMKGTIVVKK